MKKAGEDTTQLVAETKEMRTQIQELEKAAEEYPLALAYRNLAVYWNSENDPVKGNEYTQKALALDPKDPYNLVFAAVFMAANGKWRSAIGEESWYFRRHSSSIRHSPLAIRARFTLTPGRQRL